MVKIRLSRVGAKNRPFYRVIVADSRSSRDGKFIEQIGHLSSFLKLKSDVNKDIFINLDRINYWISKGAVISRRVSFLIKQYKKTGIL